MKRRIGLLTSGGDCPGLNAAIRGVARAAYEMFDAEIVGIADGYSGLINGEYREMKQSEFSGILTLGGTISVSYTHLDVYKRQGPDRFPGHLCGHLQYRGGRAVLHH